MFQAISNIIENLELQPICNKTVRTCSGGMKRKLSLAIALLGDPSFVLLVSATYNLQQPTISNFAAFSK